MASPKSDLAALAETAPSPPAAQSPQTAHHDHGLLPAAHWAQQASDDDADSAHGDDRASSTASLAASILEYRTIHGRTYHSDRSATAQHWAPNDDKQSECMDIIHHLLTLCLDGKLYRAPLDPKKIHNALDIGTGTGIWAMDFADMFPNAKVVGTDLSPTQASWVPPNLYFEIDDMTQSWGFPDESFDYVHMRYLFGSVGDWNELFRQAYRVCRPGAYVESFEMDALAFAEDGSIVENSPLDQWGKLFKEAGKMTGRSFMVITEDVQRKGLEAAGFTDLVQWDFNCPLTPWPADKKLKEMGQCSYQSLEADIEGMAMFMFTTVLNWTPAQTQVYLAYLRRQLKDRNVHGMFKLRCIYAYKPEEAPAS
ncbi:hypothetical protein N0V88_006734 [Collariella sp. IMI 366227]|nr:hypothetical protein N0V88_006734 [Collariella sp. IMI 366227]